MANYGDAALDEAVRSGRLDLVAGTLDEKELQLQQAGFPPHWPFAVHLLAHLHNHSLEDARFLCKRIPIDVRNDPEVSASFQLLQRLWNKDYQGVWGVLSGFEWSPTAAPLAAGLAVALRQRTVGLIQRAYATITAAQLAAFLGVDLTEALQIAHGAGWQYTAATNMIRVTAAEVHHSRRADSEHLQRLTEYVAHLESSIGSG